MTVARQVVAGRTHLASRRCTQRQMLLRPEAMVEEIYLYCLGEAAERYGITLHAFVAMSNHEHLHFRDNRGNFPEENRKCLAASDGEEGCRGGDRIACYAKLHSHWNHRRW